MKNGHAIGLAALVGGLAAATVLMIPRKTREPVSRHLGDPAYLPPESRQRVRMHMDHHSADMTELVWDTILLDYEATRARAERVAAEPVLVTDLASGAELKLLLPNRFYRLQDEMQAAATKLGMAALSRDPELVAQSYGRLAVTCVDCHRIYLSGPPPSP